MRYFHHPESCCVWAQDDDEDDPREILSNGLDAELISEIDEATYLRLKEEYDV